MYIYVELWKAKPSWLSMKPAERQDYLSRVQESIGGLAEEGIEPIHFALIDQEAPYSADYHYLAIWRMPHLEAAERLERDVEAAGFHELFEQVNARGEQTGPETVFGHMAAL